MNLRVALWEIYRAKVDLNLLRQYADLRRQPGWSDYLFVGLILLIIVAVVVLFIWFVGGSLWASFRFLKSIPLF